MADSVIGLLEDRDEAPPGMVPRMLDAAPPVRPVAPPAGPRDPHDPDPTDGGPR